jgi:hypothetical protein
LQNTLQATHSRPPSLRAIIAGSCTPSYNHFKPLSRSAKT